MKNTVEKQHQEIIQDNLDIEFWHDVVIVPKTTKRIDVKEVVKDIYDMRNYPNLIKSTKFVSSKYDEFFLNFNKMFDETETDITVIRDYIGFGERQREILHLMMKNTFNMKWHIFEDIYEQSRAHVFIGQLHDYIYKEVETEIFDIVTTSEVIDHIELDKHLLILVLYDHSGWNGELLDYDETGLL